MSWTKAGTGSISTVYRIACAAGQVRERRRLATRPARVCPELIAHGPEAWSWEITALKDVILDIFTRYTTGWLVAAAEDTTVAKDFLDDAIKRNGATPHTIHADRGRATISEPVSELPIGLGVLRSHSRPRTSNDDPYSIPHPPAAKTI